MPANVDASLWGRVTRLIAGALKQGDTNPSVVRMGAYGELTCESIGRKQHKLVDEGSYYWCRSPIIGTGIGTGAAVNALVDTTPFLIISNNAPALSGGVPKNIYLDYLKLQCTGAGTGGTNLLFATRIDNILRYSSGGSGSGGTGLTTVLAGPYPLNTMAQPSSNALVYAGALAAIAGSVQQRTLTNGIFRTAIPVVNDNYLINFGGNDTLLDGVLVSGTNVAQRTHPHCSVTIAPQCSFLLYLWSASQTVAASFEFELGWAER